MKWKQNVTALILMIKEKSSLGCPSNNFIRKRDGLFEKVFRTINLQR